MADDRWQVASAKWRVACGEWRTTNGRWGMADSLIPFMPVRKAIPNLRVDPKLATVNCREYGGIEREARASMHAPGGFEPDCDAVVKLSDGPDRDRSGAEPRRRWSARRSGWRRTGDIAGSARLDPPHRGIGSAVNRHRRFRRDVGWPSAEASRWGHRSCRGCPGTLGLPWPRSRRLGHHWERPAPMLQIPCLRARRDALGRAWDRPVC